jgi:hypothetical protein
VRRQGPRRCDACISVDEKNHGFQLVFGLFLKTREANFRNEWMAVCIAWSHPIALVPTMPSAGRRGEGIDFMAKIN